MHPMLNTALKAARRAAAIINRAALDIEHLQISEKQHNDFVTEIDKASEATIIETIQSAYPDHGFLCEESGYIPPSKGKDSKDYLQAENIWIIDPLDGTTNFIHGFPQYSISIALQQCNQLTQALIFDPNRNELFTATKGGGAFLNNKRIRVSKRLKMHQALIGTGFPYRDLSWVEQYLKIFRQLMQECAGIRRPGSAALDLAYVACGRLDGFFEKGLQAWDVAAGALLISESGGLVGNFLGNEDFLHTQQIAAGTPKIFAQLISILQTGNLPTPEA